MFCAKFRVLSSTFDHKGFTVPDLRPVYPNTPTMAWAPEWDRCEENRTFWEATPSGKMRLQGADATAFAKYPVGGSVKVHFEPLEADAPEAWRFGFLKLEASGVTLALFPKDGLGELVLTIQAPSTCLRLLDLVEAQRMQLYGPSFNPAHPTTWAWRVDLVPT